MSWSHPVELGRGAGIVPRSSVDEARPHGTGQLQEFADDRVADRGAARHAFTVPVVRSVGVSPMSMQPGGPAERPTPANPLLDEYHRVMANGTGVDDTREQLIQTYGFGIPTAEAIQAIRRWSPAGVVEIGAGTGYWAHLLHQREIDVVAFDVEPAPSSQSAWFAGTRPWHPVHRGDHGHAGHHPARTLLIVWPTKNETWAAEALQLYHVAGGECFVYVGEGPGGRTGDDVFHARLGELTACAQCRYGSMTSPCICSVDALWQRAEDISLPHWPHCDDNLHIYIRRAHPTSPRARRTRWGGRRPWQR